jgi:hypothetical protein
VLGMELAYFAEVQESALVLREVDGDVEGYGVARGFTLPAEYSWCHAMVTGAAPRLVRDAAALPQAAAHPFIATTGIRAYAGVSVRRADGTLYGSLCCLSREPQPQLGERDLRMLDVLARMATDLLEGADGAFGDRRAEVEAAAGQALLAALNARENYTAAHSEAVLASRWTWPPSWGSTTTAPRPSARWLCCTTSGRSASRTPSSRSGGGSRRPSGT